MFGLTWTFFHAEGPVGVLGPRIVLQLEGGGVVDMRLRALSHTSATVVEVGARLRTDRTPWSVELGRSHAEFLPPAAWDRLQMTPRDVQKSPIGTTF